MLMLAHLRFRVRLRAHARHAPPKPLRCDGWSVFFFLRCFLRPAFAFPFVRFLSLAFLDAEASTPCAVRHCW